MVETLKGFFKQNAKIVTEVEYVASKRFTDENGDPIVWRIRVLTNKELDKLRARLLKSIRAWHTYRRKSALDLTAFTDELLVRTIVFPTLDDMELQNSWGVSNELDLVKSYVKWW